MLFEKKPSIHSFILSLFPKFSVIQDPKACPVIESISSQDIPFNCKVYVHLGGNIKASDDFVELPSSLFEFTGSDVHEARRNANPIIRLLISDFVMVYT